MAEKLSVEKRGTYTIQKKRNVVSLDLLPGLPVPGLGLDGTRQMWLPKTVKEGIPQKTKRTLTGRVDRMLWVHRTNLTDPVGPLTRYCVG